MTGTRSVHSQARDALDAIQRDGSTEAFAYLIGYILMMETREVDIDDLRAEVERHRKARRVLSGWLVDANRRAVR